MAGGGGFVLGYMRHLDSSGTSTESLGSIHLLDLPCTFGSEIPGG